MKKLLFGLVAAMCCLTLAIPAFAQVKVEGMITTDIYYWDRSAEATRAQSPGTGVNDDGISQTNINLPHSWNRLTARYTDPDKKVNGYLQLRFGGAGGGTPIMSAAPSETLNGVYINYAWIDWHFNPNFYLRIGRQDQAFAVYTPMLTLAQLDTRILAMGFGNIHGGSSRDGIRGMFKFSDMVRLEVGLYDPTAGAANPGWLGAAEVGGTIRNESVIPRFDIALPIKIGNFSIEPAVTWLKQDYDQVGVGDDSIDIWGASLGAAAAFGPVSIRGEVVYGENFGSSGSYAGAGIGAANIAGWGNSAAARGAGGVVEDTETIAAWIELGFNFGPAQILGVVAYTKDENDFGVAANPNGFESERWCYGVSLPIKVAKNFTVRPEVVYYDFGDDGQIGTTRYDLGDEWVAGVQFMLTF